MFLPSIVIEIPAIRLIPTYNIRLNNSASFARFIVSFENVENVVNPPQNPTVRKRRSSVDIRLPLSNKP
jgi:hypothetical protein